MLTVYTDGACNKSGEGGHAFVATRDKEIVLLDSHRTMGTTNNREELTAILKAIKYIGEENAILYSDSQYCINTITDWMYKWEANGWKKTNKKSTPENLDLVQAIFNLLKSKNNIEFRWTRGHSGDFFNEVADALASGNTKKLHRLLKFDNLSNL